MNKWLSVIVQSANVKRAYRSTDSTGFFGNPHRHPGLYHLSYVAGGGSKLKIGGRSYKVGEGHAVFVRAGVWHSSDRKSETGKLDLLEVKFHLKLPRRWKIQPVVFVGFRPEFVNAFNSLIIEFHMNRPCREDMLGLYLAHLLLIYQRSDPGRWKHRLPPAALAHTAETREKINRALAFIQQNYKQKILLRDIARAAHISPSCLSHNFREFAGVSPVSYLINYRLTRAIGLMEKTDHKLAAIASKVKKAKKADQPVKK